jgi:DNA-binding GntR family transcriptional regulator
MPESIREIHLLMKAIRGRDENAAFKASMDHIAAAAKAGIEKLSREAETSGIDRST